MEYGIRSPELAEWTDVSTQHGETVLEAVQFLWNYIDWKWNKPASWTQGPLNLRSTEILQPIIIDSFSVDWL